MDCTYTTSALKPEQLPPTILPEVAFVGRSNAGKSSLINALTGRKSLARYSRTPGRTQMINFFTLNKKLVLADLPGYGYRTAAKKVSIAWEPLMEAFFSRVTLQEVFFLMDCRRELNDEDINLLRYLSGKKPIVLLTKCDKLSRQALMKQVAAVKAVLTKKKIPFQIVTGISTLKKVGIEELREVLNRHLYEKPIS